MGEMLRQTERAKGVLKVGPQLPNVTMGQPTLGRNKITRKVYNDIALEYLSDKDKNTPGWVCKPLLADYIAYAIAPLGKCYLLPVQQLQLTWQNNNELWRKQFPVITAKNKYNGYYWETISCCVPVNVLFKAIGQCLRVSFEQFEYEMEV